MFTLCSRSRIRYVAGIIEGVDGKSTVRATSCGSNRSVADRFVGNFSLVLTCDSNRKACKVVSVWAAYRETIFDVRLVIAEEEDLQWMTKNGRSTGKH